MDTKDLSASPPDGSSGAPPNDDRGIKESVPPPRESSLIDEAEGRTLQADLRTDQANTRTDEANTRTDQANARTEDAQALTEQAERRTERVEAQIEALRASEISYRRLFESARDGILILDAETGRVADVNSFLVELLGFSHGEIVGKTVGELSPFKDIVANQTILEQLQRGEYVRYEDQPLITRDGRQIDVEFVSNAYQAGDRKVIQCNIRDISARKRADAKLRESERFNRATLDALSANLAVLDEQGHILATNKAWREFAEANAIDWHGVSEGANYLTVCDEAASRGNDDAATTAMGIREVVAGTRQTWFHEYPCHSPTEERWFFCRVTRFPGTGAPQVVVAHENITAQKKHEHEVIRLSRLYSALSHVNQAIISLRDREELFARICRVLVEFGGLRMAWIGWLEATTQQVIPVGQWGDHSNYLSQINIYADDRPEGQGPTGTAIREGARFICNDFQGDSRTLPWRKAAEEAPFRASAAFVIRQEGLVCGAITVYADKPGFFLDAEVQLLEEAACDVSFALDNLKREEERHHAEEKLQSTKALLEAQVDSSLDGILVVDAQGKKILQNNRMSEVWKIPPEITANTDDAVQVEFVTQRTKNPRQFADGVAYLYAHPDEVGRDEIELIDGTVLDRYASPIRDREGNYYGRIWAFRDVTEQRKLEMQIRQSQKMESVGQLAGGIAHDFNNIIGVILMQSELAEMFANSPEKVREGLLEIKASAERAANLTRQLLLFSRQEVMQPRQLDVNEVVTNLASMLRRVIREDVDLELHLHSAPLMTYADASMIDQLLMNLAVNARDAMPTGGRLVIETAEKIIDAEQARMNPEAAPGRYVWLSVSDSGCGIPPEIQSRIFEPFFTTKEVGKGTGLGLATVFGVVKQHHGWLKVYSEVGRGTNFQVFLPAIEGPAEELANEPAKPKPRGGSESILVAEDNASLRMLTRAVLEQFGYHVLEATDGADAERIWGEHQGRIALLLTDLVMPGGVDGRELAMRLQRQSPGLKVIFTSGYSAEMAGRELKLHAKQMFLQKPCAMEQLLTAVRTCLDS